MHPKIKEKRWSKELEKGIRNKWDKEDLYAFKPRGRILSIDTPPPYPSGRPWHIGAAAHYSQIDMVVRAARLLGYNVFFPIGIDRNGLPVEMYTEKKYDISMHDMSREKFIDYCRKALNDLEDEMISIMKTMGLSGDFKNYYRTDSEEYRKFTQATFIELWNKGLIYVDTRPNNYDIENKTTIADAEVFYQEKETQLVHIKFPIKGETKPLIIATTRPELLCSCQLIIVNPKDSRYKHLHGKKVKIPLYNREVEVKAHREAVPTFGTGAMMICSYGDFSDVKIFRELSLPETIAIDTDGRMTKAAGPYKGMKVEEARKKIIQDLEKKEFVFRREKVKHRIPLSERSKSPVEIIPMPEYYLKQMDYLKILERYAKQSKFYPDHHRHILLTWINSVTKDWPISRRRYYATEIPIWYCKKCKEPHIPEPEKYYQPWRDPPPFEECKKCRCSDFVGEERTFDTWMDSSVSPLFITKYSEDKGFFSKTSREILRPQGKDIIRVWLFYTLLRCHQLTGRNIFRHVWITGYGVDEKGEKMSKSKGNVIDPIPILEKHGADTFRFWSAQESSVGSDFRCSEDKIEGTGKFLTKLWNVSRFISSFPFPKRARLKETDKWVLAELNKVIKDCMKGYKEFNFFIPSNRIRDFVWNIFAPHYIELAKSRAYSGDAGAHYTLHTCLKTLLILLSPITPYLTDYVHRDIYKKTVFKEKAPPTRWLITRVKTEDIVELNSLIWKTKKDRGLSLKTEIKNAILPLSLKPIESDLALTHNIKAISYGKKTETIL
jgi:valyl-tRNA synthetase